MIVALVAHAVVHASSSIPQRSLEYGVPITFATYMQGR